MQVRMWPNIGHHLWNKSFQHYASALFPLEKLDSFFLFFVRKLDQDLIQGTICILNVVLNKPEVCSSQSELWERGLPQGVDQWARDWLPCQIKIRPLFHHLIPVNLLWRNLGSAGVLVAQGLHSVHVLLICECIQVDTVTCGPSLVAAFISGLQSSLRWNKKVAQFFSLMLCFFFRLVLVSFPF